MDQRNYTEIHNIGEGIYKIVVKSVMECETCKYHSIKPFYHYFVYHFTNALNFSMIPFGPHFVHTVECVSCLCLKIANGMHLSPRKWLKVLDLVISQQPDQNMSKSLLEYDSYI